MTHPVYSQLKTNIQKQTHAICVGLDPDIHKLPAHLPQTISGVEEFLTGIIDVTSDLAIAYKPNMAFFEALGIDGLRLLERICKKIPASVPIILDGKRGDIGNTSAMQAKFIFDYFGASATTLHPYMGEDSLTPFFAYSDKYHFVLTLTSNPGAQNFQKLKLENGAYLYEAVLNQVLVWQKQYHNIGIVAGATQEELPSLRAMDPDLLFLIPGVGTQGGDYKKAFLYGKNKEGVVVINLSRSILYASSGRDYATAARQELLNYKGVSI